MAGLLSRLGRKQKKTVRAAVVVAAGSATRMEGIDKVLTPLADVPVLVRTLRVFQNCDDIDEIVVVTREDLLVEVSQLCKAFALDKVSKVVVGGKERINSVLCGLREVRQDAELIAIQDGAALPDPGGLRGGAGKGGGHRSCRSRHPGDRYHQAGRERTGRGDPGPLVSLCSADAPSV